MPAFTTALADHVADRYGMVTDAELRLLGLSESQRKLLVARELLIEQHRGVYRLRSTPASFEGRCLAICLARPDAVISGRAGGRLWGVRGMGPAPVIDVVVPHFANSVVDGGVRFRRCNVLDPGDVVERADGIRVVSPPRLIFDLSRDLSDIDLESVLEQVLDRRWCTMPTIYATGRRLYHPARPGSARFARVVHARPAWLRPVDSHHELVLFDALRAARFEGMVRQHPIALPGGWTIHADIALPRLQWAIPIDHVTWHGGRFAAQRDKQNDRQARSIGWQVDRVTDDDIDRGLAGVVAELTALYRLLVDGEGRVLRHAG
jgi:very-short-patch-repair endonuclease